MADRVLRSRFVNANGVKTHYTEVGDDGPTLVAIHGGGHGSSGKAGMGELIAALAPLRCVAPDSVGGYGMTDPYAPTPHGLLDRVIHLEHVVDALCLDRFALLGNSQGAWVAAQYALWHPERVSHLILIGSLTIGQAMGLKQEPTAAMKALQGYDGTRAAMKKLLEGLVNDPSKITDEVLDQRQAAATRPGAMEAMAAFTKATEALRRDPILSLQMDMRTTLPVLTAHIPTIFIWGQDDHFALPQTGRALEPMLPKVKFHWIAGAGHQVQNDKPEVVAAIALEFLRATSGHGAA